MTNAKPLSRDEAEDDPTWRKCLPSHHYASLLALIAERDELARLNDRLAHEDRTLVLSLIAERALSGDDMKTHPDALALANELMNARDIESINICQHIVTERLALIAERDAAVAREAVLREALEACGYWLHPAGFNAERRRLFDRITDGVANSHSLWNFIRARLGNTPSPDAEALLSERREALALLSTICDAWEASETGAIDGEPVETARALLAKTEGRR